MNPIITEQIEKFKTGDFSRYESFYNETVNTIYTMLLTIVNDQNVATSLVPQVYDKIYKNVASLGQVECFYQWAAAVVNEEALGFLRENHQIGVVTAVSGYEGIVESANLQAEMTEQIYDYAAEDEMLTITETEVADRSLITKLQEIVQTLSPIERIMFQEYYYFGVGVPEIAAKTGSKDADVRYTLSRTRTSILQAITEAPVYVANYGNPNVRRYSLSEIPWLWMVYQNFLGYTLGIDMVSVAGWSLGVLGQAAGGIAAVAGGASGASGIATGILGTVGGKIAIGVIGAAVATGIGFGAHHVITNNQTTTEIASTVEQGIETTVTTTEMLGETTEGTTEPVTEDASEERYKAYYAVAQRYMEDHPTKVSYGGNGSIEGFACAQLVDFNHDGEELLLLTYTETNMDDSSSPFTMDVYDFVDGETVLTDTFSGDFCYYLSESEDETMLCMSTFSGDNGAGTDEEKLVYTMYEYQDGKFQQAHTYTEKFGNQSLDDVHFSIDGSELTDEAYTEAFPKNMDVYYVCSHSQISYEEYVDQLVMKSLVRKHETISKLAQESQDDAFLNKMPSGFSIGDSPSEVSASLGENKYNEEYIFQFYGNSVPEISTDGQTMCIDIDDTVGYGSFCISNIGDTPIIVGGQHQGEYVWLEATDYLLLNHGEYWGGGHFDCIGEPFTIGDAYVISEEEYNAKVNALMQ